ncbi:hypothetical protein CupriaWKF_05240 [Cupriavidus sp. WKF15]|uniref:hypothetical protein n=1 Tax=Cupriavidus sp. WKF15 TaxID=3032282 RepID=UPI0023E250E5|nr:hypothetical protein [Cupriavidus sp. WKF15]WER46981.1 hypothetical protein CupriaWKF_05240 [Cupriavidus sp. WKF15]
MQARLAPRNIQEDLKELDDTERSIERLGQRIHAQERRIAELKRDGIESNSAEQIRARLCDSLSDLVKHRALILHDMTYPG